MRRLDRWALTALLLAGCGAPVATVSWTDAAPRSGEVVGDSVRIEAPASGGTFPLISLAPGGLRPGAYAIEGRVRYDDVEGDGYLEMWSVFPDGGRYFSRTLAPSGPQGVIRGASDWRGFQVPFDPSGGPSPTRLDLNLVLPAAGTVEVGPLQLRSLASGSGWWSDRTAGGLGAVAGVTIGLLGAVLGMLAARRKARRGVLTAMVVLVCVGAGSLIAGGIALIRHQPYAVVYPLILMGLILVAAFGGGYRAVRRGYEEAELRRMHALDAPGTRPA